MNSVIHKPAEINARGPTVSASPFNGVKLELGIALVLGALLWLGADSITASTEAQLLIFLGFGLLSTLWLVTRTRAVLRRYEAHETTDSIHKDT